MTLLTNGKAASIELHLADMLIADLGLETRVSELIKSGVIAGPSNPAEYIDAVLIEFIGAGVDMGDARIQPLMQYVCARIPDLSKVPTKKMIGRNIRALAVACKTNLDFIEYEAGLTRGFVNGMMRRGRGSLTTDMLLSIAFVCGVPTYVLTREHVRNVDWGMLWTELYCRGLTAPTSRQFTPRSGKQPCGG